MNAWRKVIEVKQNISIENINKLTDKQKEKMRELWEPKYGDIITSTISNFVMTLKNSITFDKSYYLPLLSIGQMIEILEKHNILFSITNMCINPFYGKRGYAVTLTNKKKHYNSEELCDALWNAIVDIMLKEE
jgi:hypothetical protein